MMPDYTRSLLNKYDISDLIKGIKNPQIAAKEVRSILFNKTSNTIRKWLFYSKYGDGTDIMQADWDNLIILDACRYDIFQDVNYIQGDLDYAISNSSTSKTFFENNICNKEFYDTVYVTANPYSPMATGAFFKMETTFSGDHELDEDRISKIKTEDGAILKNNHFENVDPENIREKTIDLYNKYPNKKFVIHFMQPHRPYIGKKAKSLRETLKQQKGITFGHWNDLHDTTDDEDIDDLIDAAMEGYISHDELLSVYSENLEIVLQYVEELISELDGKTVVTADHGELLGEQKSGKKYYTHHAGLVTEELRKVPWLVIKTAERREITAEHPIETDRIDDSDVEEQLKLLGYK